MVSGLVDLNGVLRPSQTIRKKRFRIYFYSILVSFSVAVIRLPRQQQQRESLFLPRIPGQSPSQQGLKVTPHRQPRKGKKHVCLLTQLGFFHSHIIQGQAHETLLPILRMDLPTSINTSKKRTLTGIIHRPSLSRKFLTGTLVLAILDCVKMTVMTDYHTLFSLFSPKKVERA